jgi:hypothetical protein
MHVCFRREKIFTSTIFNFFFLMILETNIIYLHSLFCFLIMEGKF